MNAFDKTYLRDDIKLIAGTDEVGRGPLAGPVVAASVIFPEGVRIRGVKDSKLLTEEEREKLLPKILNKALAYSVAVVSHGEIDRINILQASLLAMSLSIKRLKIQPHLILVDGNKIFGSSIPALPIIDGDAKSFTIAAASIIAKVTRDRIMKRLCPKFPVYNWSCNKGYATREHIEAIKNFGPCILHRRTFLSRILTEQTEFEFEEQYIG
ncbi:MAG: ribonuclease HII [Ignavibacteriales bacterium]|nr:MAG: ribonuclease HII [Ignavibacteriales bacterium]